MESSQTPRHEQTSNGRTFAPSNPLTVIASFAALVEGILALAITQVSGLFQWFLGVSFVMMFGYIIYQLVDLVQHKPMQLWGPGDFRGGVEFATWRDAFQESSEKVVQATIAQTLEDVAEQVPEVELLDNEQGQEVPNLPTPTEKAQLLRKAIDRYNALATRSTHENGIMAVQFGDVPVPVRFEPEQSVSDFILEVARKAPLSYRPSWQTRVLDDDGMEELAVQQARNYGSTWKLVSPVSEFELTYDPDPTTGIDTRTVHQAGIFSGLLLKHAWIPRTQFQQFLDRSPRPRWR